MDSLPKGALLQGYGNLVAFVYIRLTMGLLPPYQTPGSRVLVMGFQLPIV